MKKKILTFIISSLFAIVIICFTACNTDTFSKGLEFELNEDAQSYCLTGVGTATDIDIKIPSEYNGLPVTAISDFAFYNCIDIKSVIIPDSIENVGKSAFNGCTGLSSINLGKGIKQISNASFYGCSSLENIILPNGIEGIAGYAFANCIKLSEILLPKSMIAIGAYAFNNCIELKKVYYDGNEQEQEALIVRDGNAELNAARWYFFSNSTPTSDGNFWHYVDNQIAEW